MTNPIRAKRQHGLGPALDIVVDHRRSLADPWDREIQEWTVTVTAVDLDSVEPDPVPDPVCRLELVKVRLGHPDQAQLMDSHSMQLDRVGATLLTNDGELREDLLDPALLIGGHALLAIIEVEDEPAYSGLDVDRLAILEAVSLLGDGCDLAVAVTTDPPELPQPVESLDSNRFRRFWREIGFENITDQVLILYLSTTTLGEHLGRLRTSFGMS